MRGARAAAIMESFTPEDVRKYIKENVPTVSESILETIVTQKIDGEVLMEIDDEYLREIAPLVGDRLKIKKAIHKAQSFTPTVSFQLISNST